MAIPTIADIQALDYGYITGNDLLNYCPQQLLLQQYAINPNKIELDVLTAIEEVRSELISRYELKDEFDKTGSDRYLIVVKLVTVLSLINITSNLNGIPEHMKVLFDWGNAKLLAIRNGQSSLVDVTVQSDEKRQSQAVLVSAKFKTIG